MSVFVLKLCEEEVEDEIHFHLRCKKLETYRMTFIKELCISYPNLKKCNDENMFIWLMGCENLEVLKHLCNLIISLWTERDKLIKM